MLRRLFAFCFQCTSFFLAEVAAYDIISILFVLFGGFSMGVLFGALSGLLSWRNFFNVLDILLVWFLLFQLLKIIRHTKAVNILSGIFVFILVKISSSLLGLETIDWLMNTIIQWAVIGMIIIFQPEIRRALEHLGQRLFQSKQRMGAQDPVVAMVDAIVLASNYMAKRRIGALISLEKQQTLDEFVRTGIKIDAAVSQELLINIFIPNTPLHDGAVIIQGGRVASATSFLPLSENPSIPKNLGTRHRAAVGLSEVSDALTVIVSEETGNISVTYEGQIKQALSPDDLRQELLHHFQPKENSSSHSRGLAGWLTRFFAAKEDDDE